MKFTKVKNQAIIGINCNNCTLDDSVSAMCPMAVAGELTFPGDTPVKIYRCWRFGGTLEEARIHCSIGRIILEDK